MKLYIYIFYIICYFCVPVKNLENLPKQKREKQGGWWKRACVDVCESVSVGGW